MSLTMTHDLAVTCCNASVCSTGCIYFIRSFKFCFVLGNFDWSREKLGHLLGCILSSF
jgi:hypothetical protein